MTPDRERRLSFPVNLADTGSAPTGDDLRPPEARSPAVRALHVALLLLLSPALLLLLVSYLGAMLLYQAFLLAVFPFKDANMSKWGPLLIVVAVRLLLLLLLLPALILLLTSYLVALVVYQMLCFVGVCDRGS